MKKYHLIIATVLMTILFSGKVYSRTLDENVSKSIIQHTIWGDDWDALKTARMNALNESIKKRLESKECFKDAGTPDDLHVCERIIAGVRGKIPAYQDYDEQVFRLAKQNIVKAIDEWLISAQKEVSCVQAATDTRMVCSCDFLTRERPTPNRPATAPSR